MESFYHELAKVSVLGLILCSSPYLRSAKARFPLLVSLFTDENCIVLELYCFWSQSPISPTDNDIVGEDHELVKEGGWREFNFGKFEIRL